MTFRAAGTSLSGQAVTDSILLKLSHTGKNWRRHAIGDEGKAITVEPGLIGGRSIDYWDPTPRGMKKIRLTDWARSGFN